MTSIYDKISTPKELVMEARTYGFSTEQNDICRAQDIFGNAPIEDLVALANDIGRNNSDGEPDPNGSWSSGRLPTRDTFYMILFSIWDWEQATRFWNQYSNPEHEDYLGISSKLNEANKRAENAECELKRMSDSCKELKEKLKEAVEYIYELQDKQSENDNEILRLKAKIYDLMFSKEKG